MITLAADDRVFVDTEIGAALDRLTRRSVPLGDGPRALAEAAAAAGADGKRLRPALVVAAFRAFGGEPDAALWRVAAAFELLHTAFVVHDDLIDGDLERRGAPNVSGRFRTRARAYGARGEDVAVVGDAAAVLAGDLLLFEASRLVATADIDADARTRLFAILDDAVLVSAAGELADVENAARAEVPETDELLGAAHDKTAVYSFEAPLVAGAVLAGATPEAQADLAAAAADLGLAFQLVDDLIGTFGTRRQAGRDPGADLREAKRTPLIGLARRSGAWPEISSALAVAHTGPIAVRRAQRELERSGAREHVVALVHEGLDRARTHAAGGRLPVAAASLLDDIGSAIERRIP
ncbi:polyprenyl synthetase family protein [Microbacterium flavum]|uniref:Polyprenyl synthetase family protein n=1 Tax=Microbacterium flavum TaxID=415216 RepID=A0ABS5XTT1_9MICO|nr:polyprenyl synthetase family protein [Microbacterium flavum]MBT8797361.1 polyprenyl synthetase family protein [Microbacterium flavum]